MKKRVGFFQKDIVAYATINKATIVLLKSKSDYFVSIFSSLEAVSRLEEFPHTKKLSFKVASKRFAKLCKAAQTMTFKTESVVAN